jgi:small-conductance mechanosensitive channel
MRTLFIEPFRKQFSTLSLDAKSLDALQQQQSRLSDLVAQVQTVSPAIAALDKQRMLLKLYGAHLTERRSEIRTDYRASWKMLLVRLGILGVEIAILLVISAIFRRLTFRQHDSTTCQMLLVSQRILRWLIIVILVLFAFAFDVSSLATFVGLLFAGLAVGLHDVLLAIGGYLLIVGKFHVRVGNRVQVATVTGEVTNLGLMEFQLTEIDSGTGERTGRVVFFSTSYVFRSPSTPLFKQISASA